MKIVVSLSVKLPDISVTLKHNAMQCKIENTGKTGRPIKINA